MGTDIIPPKVSGPTILTLTHSAQPMDYNYFKLHQIGFWKVNGNFYVGAGLHFDSYSKIVDKTLDTANSLFTHHYNYSTKYGFNSTDYTVNGVSKSFITIQEITR